MDDWYEKRDRRCHLLPIFASMGVPDVLQDTYCIVWWNHVEHSILDTARMDANTFRLRSKPKSWYCGLLTLLSKHFLFKNKSSNAKSSPKKSRQGCSLHQTKFECCKIVFDSSSNWEQANEITTKENHECHCPTICTVRQHVGPLWTPDTQSTMRLTQTRYLLYANPFISVYRLL